MKNILIITEKFSLGGLENHIKIFANYWHRKGNRLFLVYVDGDLYPLKNVLIKTLRIDNVDFYDPDFAQTVLKLMNFMKDNSIEVVIIHPLRTFFAGSLAAILLNIPFYLVLHGPYSLGEGLPYANKIILKELIFRYVQKVFVVSEELKMKFSQDNKIIYIPNPINSNINISKNSSNINDKLITFVGRLDQDKAASIFHAKELFTLFSKYNFKIQIVGDGDAFNEVKNWFKQNFNLLQVNYLGAITETGELNNIYNKSSIVLGMGRVVLEALVLNKPIILLGYDGPKGFVTINNFKELSVANFSGRGIKNIEIKKLDYEITSKTYILPSKMRDFIISQYSVEVLGERMLKEMDTSNKINFQNELVKLFNQVEDFEESKNEITQLKRINSIQANEIETLKFKLEQTVSHNNTDLDKRLLELMRIYRIDKIFITASKIKNFIRQCKKKYNNLSEKKRIFSLLYKETFKRKVIIVFQSIPWNFRKQRVHHLMERFAELGNIVIIVNFNSNSQEQIKIISKRIYEINIEILSNIKIYNGPLDSETIKIAKLEIEKILSLTRASSFIYYNNFPGWFKLIDELNYTNPGIIIYDYVDDNTQFPNTPEYIAEYEEMSIVEATIVLATSKYLLKKAIKLNKRSFLVRNAANLNDFNRNLYKISQSRRETFGYIGAINDWFDMNLINKLIFNKPEWEFHLIGRKEIDFGLIENAKNVKFYGEVNYKDLQKYYKVFNIAIIPFINNSLTESTNPVKMYEYLAAGKKVLSFRNEETYEALGESGTYIDYNDFIKKAEDLFEKEKINYPINIENETWEKRVEEIDKIINELRK